MEVVSQPDMLTVDELRLALNALLPVELIRLEKKAKALAPGTGMDPDDLLQEAVRRAIDEDDNERRHCPRSVNLTVFLGNVMRSIASHERLKWEREMPMGGGDSEEEEKDVILSAPDPTPTPEEQTISRLDCGRIRREIEALFEGDPKALAVVTGDMEGWSPQEIRELEPMNEAEYAAARKRVRRTLLRNFPEGKFHD